MTKRGDSVLGLDLGVSSNLSPSASERSLDVAFALGSGHVVPKMPWEQNSFLQSVMGPSTVPWLRPAKMLRSASYMPYPNSEKPPLTVLQKKDIVRTICHEKLQVRADSDRMAALLRWVDIFMINPEKNRPGKMLLECCGDENLVLRTLSDLFAKKATSTIRTRSGSIAMYCSWHLSTFPGESVFPIQESHVYQYACSCREAGKSASRMDTFIGTLRYIAGEFGVEGADEAAKSPRVVGAAHSMLLTRAPRKRPEPLTTIMLCWLEICCFALPDAFDRMIAGMCMMCCMGRLRCADTNRIRHAGLLGRFVEGALSRTKTARSKEKATSFIPLVVPAFGLLGKPWYLEFVKARDALELQPIPSLRSRAHDLSFVMVPEHAGIAYETQKPMGSVELTDRMRAMLALGFETGDIQDVTSHSLKTTLLAYMNIFGCDLGTSELLGYHVNKEHSSALNYTRDCLSAPVRSLTDMLHAVHEGTFVPQASRDEVFRSRLAAVHISEQFKHTTGLDVMDAALVLQQDAVYETSADRDEADDRLSRLRQDGQIPRCGMMQYLTDDEDMTLRSVGDVVTSPSSVDESSDGSSSSEEEEARDASLSAIAAYHERVQRSNPSSHSDLSKFFRHSRTKVLHCIHKSDADKTGCGRKIGSSYYEYVGPLEAVYPKCKHCFGASV